MSFWLFVGEISFLVLIGFFFTFTLYSYREKEEKAFQSSLLFLLGLIVVNILFLIMPGLVRNLLFLTMFLATSAAVFILFFSTSPSSGTKIIGEQKKVDERDTIFSRFEHREKSKNYNDYYSLRPEYKTVDDEIRVLPDILTPEHTKKDPVLFSLAAAEDDYLKNFITLVSGEVKTEKMEMSPFDNTQKVKKIIKYLGADICGVCELDQAYVYSHVGRGPEPFGAEIHLKHKYAIVFAMEMERRMIAASPKPPVLVETERMYVEVAKVAIIVSALIRRLGYEARAHIAGSNYQAILPPLAWKAGIGEIGRIGILITEKYGPRVRLGLITTNLPLTPDTPKAFGVQDFCRKCKKCANNCPAQAIPFGDKTEENGVLKWVLNREGCYRFWRKAGTDCAMCLYVCPYSKPRNWFHDSVRKLNSQSSTAQAVSLWADDYFYGRIPLPKEPPF
jgi:reductive dehalogenase